MKAEVHIHTTNKNGQTIPGKCYCTTPFKIANITERNTGNELHLMLMNSSPGVLDNDAYNIAVTVNESCSLQIHTQSYQRLFTMHHKAVQHLQVTVASNGCFTFLPHPSVPHAHSNYQAYNAIYLHNNSQLYWSDILTAGRNVKNEIFEMTRYGSTTKIYVNGKLAVKELIVIDPKTTNINSIGQMEGFTHQSSFIWVHPLALQTKITETIIELLKNEMNIHFGVTSLAVPGYIIRILGCKAEQLYSINQSIYSYLRNMVKEETTINN